MTNTQSHSKLIKSFVANTIDIYHEQCIETFLKDGKLNIDVLVKHNLTKITIVYQAVWNHLFGTWATKKDVMSFYDDVLNIKWNYQNFLVEFDMNFLNAILAHEPFVLARMGVIHKMSSVRETYSNVVAKINASFEPPSVAFICDSLQQRWKHRFGVSDFDMMHLGSILKTFVKYQLNDNVVCEEDCKIWQSISGYMSECKEIDTTDLDALNKREVIQYYIHRDNRFLLQLATQVVLVADEDYCDKNNTFLIDAINKHLKKNAIVLRLNEAHDQEKCKTHRFDYQVTFDTYKLLPKIATKFYLLSDKERVSSLKLCTILSESFLITENARALTLEQNASFSFLMTTNINKVCPELNCYYMPLAVTHSFKEVATTVVADYFKQKSPFETNNARNNGLLYANFVLMYLNRYGDKVVKVLADYCNGETNSKSLPIVSVDNRFNALTLMAVVVSLYNIVRWPSNSLEESGVGYKGCIYTSKSAKKQYIKLLEEMGLSQLVTVKVWKPFESIGVFHIEMYNDVMKSAEFWKSIGNDSEMCLIVQDDGFLVNGVDFGKYLEYDYVGAPWADAKDNEYLKKFVNPEMVGNGGFSLRNVKRMIEVCERFEKEKYQLFYYNINEIPEDVYFVKHLKAIGANVAPFEVARKFSVEQIMTVDPVGFHKFWLYNVPAATEGLFKGMLG